jgi:hypothetical protein
LDRLVKIKLERKSQGKEVANVKRIKGRWMKKNLWAGRLIYF